MGPSDSAGKNVSAPTTTTVPTRSPTNSGPWSGRVPADVGTAFFRARLPATASSGNEEEEASEEHASPRSGCTTACSRVMPPNALPLFPVSLVYAYRISLKP